MKCKTGWFEKKVDERQEMDLLRVEHMSFWSMYWMLLAAMIIQIVFVEEGGRMIMGEWIVFMASSVLLVAGCIRKGVWNYQTRKIPGMKAYLRYSLVAMVVAGIPLGLLYGYKSAWGKRIGIWACIAGNMAGIFVVSIFAFMLVGALAKKREIKLAEQDIETEDEEER